MILLISLVKFHSMEPMKQKVDNTALRSSGASLGRAEYFVTDIKFITEKLKLFLALLIATMCDDSRCDILSK